MSNDLSEKVWTPEQREMLKAVFSAGAESLQALEDYRTNFKENTDAVAKELESATG